MCFFQMAEHNQKPIDAGLTSRKNLVGGGLYKRGLNAAYGTCECPAGRKLMYSILIICRNMGRKICTYMCPPGKWSLSAYSFSKKGYNHIKQTDREISPTISLMHSFCFVSPPRVLFVIKKILRVIFKLQLRINKRIWMRLGNRGQCIYSGVREQ